MPAESKAQQRLMGMALSYKRGLIPAAPPQVKAVANEMSATQLKHFAGTKRTGLPEKKAFVAGFLKAGQQRGFSTRESLALLKRAGYSLTNADLTTTIRNFNPKKPNIQKPLVNKQSFKSKYPDVNKDINISEPAAINSPTIKHHVVKNPKVKDPPVLKQPAEIKTPVVKAPKPITPPQMPLEAKTIDSSQSALSNRSSAGTQLSS